MTEIDPKPYEDLDDGLYLHEGTCEVTEITVGEDTVHLVPVRDFMEMQKERDEYRRAVALLNAWIHSQRPREVALGILEKAGFDEDQAKAMNSIIATVQNEIKSLVGSDDK